MNTQEIVSAIERERRRQGVSMRALSGLVGRAHSWWRDVAERRFTNPHAETLEDAAKALGLSLVVVSEGAAPFAALSAAEADAVRALLRWYAESGMRRPAELDAAMRRIGIRADLSVVRRAA